MKARIKATGEIIEVMIVGTLNGNRYRRTDGQNELYESKDLDLNLEPIINPDHWTRLEHQAAIAAMQGLVTRGEVLGSSVQEIARDIAEISCEVAHALVEKMKEEK